MALSTTEYRFLEKVLKRYFKENKIQVSDTKPDIFQLAKDMGFDVREAIIRNEGDTKIEGVLLVDERKKNVGKFNGPRGIALNYTNEEKDNSFIIAHELSHYIFEKSLLDSFDKPLVLAERRIAHKVGVERNLYEQAIDYMAAAILLPLDDFSKKYEKAKGIKEYKSFREEQSDFYDVSEEAIDKRRKEVEELNCNE